MIKVEKLGSSGYYLRANLFYLKQSYFTINLETQVPSSVSIESM